VPITFENFEEMLQRTKHFVRQSSEKASVIARIIGDVSRLITIWKRRNGLADLL
jgi:hypothetical protein